MPNLDLIPDIPRIYTALAEFLACMVYVIILKKRFKGVKKYFLAIGFLLYFIGFQFALGLLPIFLWIPGMIFAMCSMCLCIIAQVKISWVEAVFWTARAFVLAEFAASLEWQIFYFFAHSFKNLDWIVFELIILTVIYSLVFIASFFLEKRYSASSRHLKFQLRDLISAVGIALTVFLISNISFVSSNTPLSGKYAGEIYYIRTIVDLCGIILFYAQQEQRYLLHARLELDAMQNILSRQYEQYCLSKENIELINCKYHDLKHQIAVIKEEKNPEKKFAFLDEMEKEIKMYEAQNKTGNNVLDTILTGKSMFCAKNDINLTCVADGTLLNFMEIMDICSIVGNALDNAIESVSKLEDKGKRLIKVAIYAQNDLLMLRFENYLENRVKFENGLPLTTKNKNQNHGYGVKSIKMITEKYGGNIKIITDNNWFTLCLLIPKPSIK